MIKPSLHDLARKYNCDKLYFHSYILFYGELFRHKTVNKLLEIGIGYRDLMAPLVPEYVHGASLKMWEEYFQEANVYGCDIREDTLVNEGRITSVICDQSQPLSLLNMVGLTGGCFDVIIDDGSHLLAHQILSAATLMPYLNRGGIYVIEDVGLENLKELARLTSGEAVVCGRRPDDNLVVIHK